MVEAEGPQIPKAVNTHSQHVLLITCQLQNGWTNAPQCYVYT